jgi:hypothetical protein
MSFLPIGTAQPRISAERVELSCPATWYSRLVSIEPTVLTRRDTRYGDPARCRDSGLVRHRRRESDPVEEQSSRQERDRDRGDEVHAEVLSKRRAAFSKAR